MNTATFTATSATIDTEIIACLRAEMAAHYEPLRHARIADNAPHQARLARINAAMDTFVAAHPDTPPVLLKARLHAEIAAQCEPVIFPHSPFFFELGLRQSENWGVPGPHCAGNWLLARQHHLCHDTPEWRNIQAYQMHNNASPLKVWGIWDVFDSDHHCLGFTILLELGIDGIRTQLATRRHTAAPGPQSDFLDAADQGCAALLRVAAKFAAKAEAMLATETDPDVRACLQQLATAAQRVPALPPRTFFEGLAALLFLREAIATLEGIGISVIGHLDRVLIGLYRQDLQAGRLTEAQAANLLARWMLHTDIKFHVQDNPWPETSTCIELGGCDATGAPLYNELTRLIIEVHHGHRLLNPKLNCRYSARSPKEYLDLLASKVLTGHNNFAFLNDDILIPAAVRSGKTEAEARLYVNGGCQEPMVEGYEHTAGAYYYVNMARILDLCLRPIENRAELPAGVDYACLPEPIDAGSAALNLAAFDAFYSRFFAALQRLVEQGAAWARVPGQRWPEVHPCPLFSVSLHGCIDKAQDYTAGGAKYNPSGIALVGFGTVVDALFAIRRAVFEEQWCTLEELRRLLAANWAGHEGLRLRFQGLPKFGHGHAEVDALAVRFATQLAAFCNRIPNERGDHFQASLFVYYMFVGMGQHVRATPDGRRDGDMLSQGISPGRLQPSESVTDIFRSLAGIDFRDFPANAVLDLQLPLTGSDAPASLSAVLRTFADIGGATVQPNCVSVAQLREAQTRPEQYRDLTVRISGLSARFIALPPALQEEIISRTLVV